MLPDGFKWGSIYGPAGPAPMDALYCGLQCVARLDERVGGGWVATLNLPGGRWRIRACASRESGQAGVEAWARRHQVELAAWAEREYLRYQARCCWNGPSAGEARRRLEAMGESVEGVSR